LETQFPLRSYLIEADISLGVATRFHFDACFFLKRSNYRGCVFVAEAEVNSRVARFFSVTRSRFLGRNCQREDFLFRQVFEIFGRGSPAVMIKDTNLFPRHRRTG